MRARKKKWASHELKINKNLIIEPEQYKGVWNKLFGNTNELHLEIGCGKGRFITESALLNPGINFIGIDREEQVIISGMRRAREMQIINIKFILTDVELLPSIFGENEINRLYINFCDPWPNRKKWAKRRLTHINFLNIYKTILNGRLYLKTDNRELFEFSLEQFNQNNWDISSISWDLHKNGCKHIMTEYEEKFYNEGIPIMRCEAQYKP